MVLKALELINIRSYKSGLFQFSSGVNIVVGPNASGRTNLLEAIYMVCQGKPFKSSDNDMVHRDTNRGRIEASFDKSQRTVKIKKDHLEKKFVVDDIDKKRLLGDSLIPVVLFEPSHMLLLGGEPERRRNYIDGLLSQVVPSFKKTLGAYKRALAQRNRLLKQDNIEPEHLFVWDVRISELAGEIVEHRLEYVDIINGMFTRDYRSVSGNKEVLELVYETKLNKKQY